MLFAIYLPPDPAVARSVKLDDGSVVLLDAQNRVLDIVQPLKETLRWIAPKRRQLRPAR